MRARIAGVFALGFAAGMLCVSLGLWGSGALRIPGSFGWHHQPPIYTAPMPEMPASPRTALAPPPDIEGQADRLAPETVAPPNAPHLLMPIAGVDPNRLEDTFGQARDGRKHDALDIMAPKGTPVLAVDEGNVVKLFTSKQGGLTVYQFNDAQTLCYYYAHLDHYATGLKEGTLMRKGEVLGYVGSTGDASPSAPHLHFSVFRLGPDKKWWQGTAIDPLPLLK
jgi:murein DD-endopeptidase MepM/ murein hydrolase activator NlpD